MLPVDQLSKENVYNVMLQVLYSFNFVWFKFEDWAQNNHREEFESELFRKLYEDFGSNEARRLASTLHISGQEVNDIIEILRCSHWAIFENIEVTKLTEKKLSMRTIDCSAQRAAKKAGHEYHDCRIVGHLLRKGFFRAINRDVDVQRIFTPPESRPKDIPEKVSCEWLILLK